MQILKADTERRRLGDFGEKEAVKFLRRQGYKIVKTNYVDRGHEIDIVAENREYLIFVEVKTRDVARTSSMEARPASAVDKKKQMSIITAAKYLCAVTRDKKKRFDIIEVYVEMEKDKPKVKDIKHLMGAFNLNTAMGR